ncbi:hypothetical protein CAPTEDRAFT_158323 [Capitella teleta]|uniref:Uncharacterized protein n=1 Tax=Capitella teleta TaxID=283909 RepID=R7UFB6_CAPTE|nr:hypothetical protein CAPTEDRAFT_158323 [Capitella teleta]|eukprot:ELU01947.1 hypothetical protein CAPTEDRAFT_158323 [Capitella teleta]
MLCSRCRLLHRMLSSHSMREASSFTKRIKTLEDRESTVHEHVGQHKQRVQRVYVWGYAGTGALGQRSFITPSNPRQKPRSKQRHPHRLAYLDEIVLKTNALACGYGFTVFIGQRDSKPVAFGTGINTDSQLGFQEYPKKSGRILDYVIQPVGIDLPLENSETKLLQVACGRAHTVIVTDQEGCFTLGNNAYGQCGRGIVEKEIYGGSQTVNRVEVEGIIKQVVCGQDHSLFLMDDGRVFSCGIGSDGQTGLGHYKSEASLSLVGGDIEGEDIVHLSCKGDTVLAVSGKGDLFGWGNSEYDQLSSVSNNETQVNVPRHLPFSSVGHVVRSASAGAMCLLLNDKGDVYVWGYGLLGCGPQVEQSALPMQIPPTLFGKNELNPDAQVVDLQCGLYHFAALTSDGDLFTWGRNMRGALGLGTAKDQYFPYKVHVPAEVMEVRCGVDHMAAICRSFI